MVLLFDSSETRIISVTNEEAIATWSQRGSAAKRIAAQLARELIKAPEGTKVESSMKMAERFNASHSSVVRARRHLMGQKLIHKSGSRYYTGAPTGRSEG